MTTETFSTPAPPVAYVTGKQPNPTYPGSTLLTVTCPGCGRTHTHGAPEGDTGPDYGHRVAHCTNRALAPHGYYVRERVAP